MKLDEKNIGCKVVIDSNLTFSTCKFSSCTFPVQNCSRLSFEAKSSKTCSGHTSLKICSTLCKLALCVLFCKHSECSANWQSRGVIMSEQQKCGRAEVDRGLSVCGQTPLIGTNRLVSGSSALLARHYCLVSGKKTGAGSLGALFTTGD